MANLNMANQGKAVALAALLGKTAAAVPLTLRLFSNDRTPADGDVFADYTEVAGGGYAAFALTAASWAITTAAPAVASYAPHSFTFTGATTAPGTIYGYYITDNNNKLVAAQRLDAPPFTPATNGDSVTVTPQITLGDAV